MNNLIERYVNEVVKRLKESERDEVSKELNANIYDMLSDNPDEQEVKDVLTNLGSPKKLASKYKGNKNYLISPEIYDTYIGVLKWIVPTVSVISFVLGTIIGIFENLENGLGELIWGSMGEGLSYALSGAFYALSIVTIVFVIIERVPKDKVSSKWKINDTWNVDELTDRVKAKEKSISLPDSIGELIIVSILEIIFLLIVTGLIQIPITINGTQYLINEMLDANFASKIIPITIVMLAMSIGGYVTNIIVRKWNIVTFIVAIAVVLVLTSLSFYVFNSGNILNDSVATIIVDTVDWNENFDASKLHSRIALIGNVFTIFALIIGIIVPIYKTFKSKIFIENVAIRITKK